MSKKALIIMLSVLGLIIISLISWLVWLNRPSASLSTINTVATTPDANNTTLPTDKPISQATITQSKPTGSNKDTEVVIEDRFQWVRIVFTNENDASRRLTSYFERTGLDQELILDKCNLASDSQCLADYRSVLKTCQLTGEEWTHLPLAFDRSTKRCYQTYSDIVSYLNDELATVRKNRR